MKTVLDITRLICENDQLFFLTEESGIFGEIKKDSGDVIYYRNTPKSFLGHLTARSLMVGWNNEIYIFCSDNGEMIQYTPEANEFKKIYFDNELLADVNDSVMFQNKEIVYFFPRSGGKVIECNLPRREVKHRKINIEEKIVWACGYEQTVYLLSWDCNKIYCYSLVNHEAEEYASNILKWGGICSRTPFPIHNMICDENNIYIHDADKVFSFDKERKETSVLFCSSNSDNAARIISCDNSVIIPPFSGEIFHIIDKRTGKLKNEISFPKGVTFLNKSSKTGIPCENGHFEFLPVTNSDILLSVDKHTEEFIWTPLHIDTQCSDEILRELLNDKVIVNENSAFTLERYLRCLM